MKYSLIIALALIGLFSCNNSDRNEKHEKLVNAYLDSVSNKSPGLSFLSEDYMHYGPMIIDSVSRAQWIELMRFAETQESFYMKIDKYSVHSKTINDGEMKGDWVFIWGKLTSRFLDDHPIGTNWYHWSFKIENDKIAEERVIFDNLDILRQEGYKLDIKPDSIYTAVTGDSTGGF